MNPLIRLSREETILLGTRSCLKTLADLTTGGARSQLDHAVDSVDDALFQLGLAYRAAKAGRRRLADLTFDAEPTARGTGGTPSSTRHGVANTPSASSPGRDAPNPPAAAAGAHNEATA